MWQFDSKVADTFPLHARQHIPNYEQVIEQCVEVCSSYDRNSKIIDVGCATGETLIALQNNGFTNLYGVDNSPYMLSKCKHKGFNLILSDSFPKDNFDIVLANWTLHFIREKELYIKNIYDSLSPGGFCIITDKTSNDPFPINYYHAYKSKMGVSNEDIIAKAESVKDIMHINDVQWYLDILKSLGFKNTYIINAYWCFTSFVCLK